MRWFESGRIARGDVDHIPGPTPEDLHRRNQAQVIGTLIIRICLIVLLVVTLITTYLRYH